LWPRPERFDAHERELEAKATQAEQASDANNEPGSLNDANQSSGDAADDDSEQNDSDPMNAMLSGDNAAEPAPLEAAFAERDQNEEDPKDEN